MRADAACAWTRALIVFVLCLPAWTAWAIEQVDDRGERIHLAAPAQRIVTLAPDLAELIAGIGAADALVGVSRGSDYPAAVKRVPSVGDSAGIDAERVLALRPDLVLAWRSGNRTADLERLERLGLTLFVSEVGDLESVPRLMRRLGVLTGRDAPAATAARAYEARLAGLVRSPAGAAVAVFIEIWDRPLMTVNGRQLISDVVTRCGGRNIFADLPVLAGGVSIESLLARDPALIVSTMPAPRGAMGEWSRWPQLRAVRDKAVRRIDPDLVSRATPRILDGMQSVCEWVAQAQARSRP